MKRALDPKPVVLLIALVIASTAWRVQLARESLWIDELHSAWCAGGELREVAPRAAIGNQSPLYFWLLWAQARVLPPSELSLRAPSLAAGALLIVAAFWMTWRWLGSEWLGLLAAWLIALDPLAIQYATEARPYSLVMLLALLHVALFAELCRQPTRRRRAGFVLAAALLFHLHYTTALLLPAELLFWFVAVKRRLMPVRYSLRQLTFDAALIGISWLPAALLVGSIFGRRQNWIAFIEQPHLDELFDVLAWSAAALFVLAAVLVDRYVLERGVDAPSNDALRVRRFAILCLCWLLVPLLMAWLATASDLARLFFARYLVVSAPAAVLLAAACVRLVRERTLQILVGGWFAAAGLWISVTTEAGRGEDWRSAVTWLNEALKHQPLPVLVASDLIEDQGLREPHEQALEDYCLFPVNSLYKLNAPRSDMHPLPGGEGRMLGSETRQELRSRGGAWLIVRTKELEDANAIGQALVQQLNAGDSDATEWRVVANHRGQRVQIVLLLPRSRSQTSEP